MTFLYKRRGTVWSKIHMELDWNVEAAVQENRAWITFLESKNTPKISLGKLQEGITR